MSAGDGRPLAAGLVVLTGGASRRMGRDKASMDVGGRPLAARPVEALRGLTGELVLAGRAVPGLAGRVVADQPAGSGPLAGVVAGLLALGSPLAVVVGCDMPSVSAAVVGLLLDRLRADPGVDAAVCASRTVGVEPLPMAVRTAAAPVMAAGLRSGGSLRAGLDSLRTEVVPVIVWERLDPTGGGFVSWNRPEDVERPAG